MAQPISLTAKYAFIQAQPLYGFPNDRHEVTLGGTARLLESWRLFASATYDLQYDVLTNDSLGFGYNDECFSYTMTYGDFGSHAVERAASHRFAAYVAQWPEVQTPGKRR